jgi:hypothetical protein
MWRKILKRILTIGKMLMVIAVQDIDWWGNEKFELWWRWGLHILLLSLLVLFLGH